MTRLSFFYVVVCAYWVFASQLCPFNLLNPIYSRRPADLTFILAARRGALRIRRQSFAKQGSFQIPGEAMIDASDILNSKILIVDDHQANVRDLKRMLAAGGYMFVASTLDLHEACELHRKNRYNLILLDLHMPNLDGFELMKCIRDIEPEGYLPILVITAEPAHRLRALQAGAKDFISKPFDQAEVLMRIHNLLEVRLLQIEAKNYGEFLEQMVDERTVTLRDSEELFRQIATNIPEALWIRNCGSDMLRYVNPAWQKITGWSAGAGDRLDKLFEVFHPDDLQRVRDEAECHPNGGSDLECRIVRPDKTMRWVHVHTFPIEDSEGELYRVAGILKDITNRKESNQRVGRLKDEFVSTVSHELRTPLTSISGSIGLLLGGGAGQLPDAAQRLLAIAQSNSERLVRLLNDILDIEKIESGKLIFDLERIAVRPLVEQAIESIRGFAEGYGIPVRFEAGANPADVCADSYRLLQVITNLLSNAIKFSPRGEEVMVSIHRDAHSVRVSIRDHGPGIPEDFKCHVFEKFAQADTSDAQQKGGTGLGLSIVREIVTRLGGDVGFEDAAGGGTIFHITLPSWQATAGSKADSETSTLALASADQECRSGSRVA